MDPTNIFLTAEEITPENYADVMQSAIALELATIPTYLSTYYSIRRAQDQDTLAARIKGDLDLNALPVGTNIDDLVDELTVDVLVHANKTAALVMSVVIEEMLHLSLVSNVKQATIKAPDIMGITKSDAFKFPTYLAGHQPEFWINLAPLSPDQLNIFLQIESPKEYKDPNDPDINESGVILDYPTIGGLYNLIIDYVEKNCQPPFKFRSSTEHPQLVPSYGGKPTPYYSANSINTVYYDRQHNPHFGSSDGSGGPIEVTDVKSAVAAMNEIKEQGEGNDTSKEKTLLTFDDNGMPVPLPVVDGKVTFQPGDYDDNNEDPNKPGTELSHFAKFLEAYSMGAHYQEKFAKYNGLNDFYDYFVYNQAKNPKQADYDSYLEGLKTNSPQSLDLTQAQALSDASKLGNAIFTYLILMVETCYHVDPATQFNVFMYGVHKAMIWLLSGVGNGINAYTYVKDGETYNGAVTFEFYEFSTETSPKSQIIDLLSNLAQTDPGTWGWATQGKYKNYWQALPDVDLNHKVEPNVPPVPAH